MQVTNLIKKIFDIHFHHFHLYRIFNQTQAKFTSTSTITSWKWYQIDDISRRDVLAGVLTAYLSIISWINIQHRNFTLKWNLKLEVDDKIKVQFPNFFNLIHHYLKLIYYWIRYCQQSKRYFRKDIMMYANHHKYMIYHFHQTLIK